MPVDPSVPADSALVSASAAQLRANFLAVNTEIDVDHYSDTFTPPLAAPYNVAVAGDVGHHKKVDLVRASGDPAAPGADNGILYTQTGIGALTQLFYLNSGGSVQMTGVYSLANNGYTTLPGGIHVKWGASPNLNHAVGGAFTTFNYPGPAFTAVWNTLVTPSYAAVSSSMSVYAFSSSFTQLTVVLSEPNVAGIKCFFLAIGTI